MSSGSPKHNMHLNIFAFHQSPLLKGYFVSPNIGRPINKRVPVRCSAHFARIRRYRMAISSEDSKRQNLEDIEDKDIYEANGYLPTSFEDNCDENEITMKGKKTLDQVAKEVRTDIESLKTSSNFLANQFTEDESQALLHRFENYKEDLIQGVERERKILQEEVTKLESMLSSYGRGTPGHTSSPAVKMLRIATILLSLASCMFAINGILLSNSQMLSNATVDALVAVCATYILTKYTEK